MHSAHSIFMIYLRFSQQIAIIPLNGFNGLLKCFINRQTQQCRSTIPTLYPALIHVPAVHISLHQFTINIKRQRPLVTDSGVQLLQSRDNCNVRKWNNNIINFIRALLGIIQRVGFNVKL